MYDKIHINFTGGVRGVRHCGGLCLSSVLLPGVGKYHFPGVLKKHLPSVCKEFLLECSHQGTFSRRSYQGARHHPCLNRANTQKMFFGANKKNTFVNEKTSDVYNILYTFQMYMVFIFI